MSMVAMYARLSADQLDAALDDFDSAEFAQILYLDKAYDGIRYLLNTAGCPVDLPWDGKQMIDAETATEEDFEAWSYGPPVYLKPKKVRRVAAFVQQWPFHRLREHYDPVAMTRAKVYPSIWQEQPEAVDYLDEYYEPLRELLAAAAKDGDVLVVWIS